MKDLRRGVLVLILLCCQFFTCSFSRKIENDSQFEREFTNHRLGLLEGSVSVFVQDASEKMTELQEEIAFLHTEAAKLRTTVEEQRKELNDLQWAATHNKANQLTREEKDLVTELKWTIFDLKNANIELQEESCFRNTECGEWAEWSQCSVSCGRGTKIRARECVKSGRFSSMCEPLTVQEEPCRKDCISATGLSQFDCQDGYSSFHGYCLRFSGRQDSRLLSTILCEEEGAHLVLVDSWEKQKIVKDFIDIVAPEHMVDMHEDFSKREYWDFHDIDQKVSVAIDGIRKHQKRDFTDWRGQNMTFLNWATGEPRNDRSDGDYCVTMNVLSGDWYMRCCSVTFFYICESEKRL